MTHKNIRDQLFDQWWKDRASPNALWPADKEVWDICWRACMETIGLAMLEASRILPSLDKDKEFQAWMNRDWKGGPDVEPDWESQWKYVWGSCWDVLTAYWEEAQKLLTDPIGPVSNSDAPSVTDPDHDELDDLKQQVNALKKEVEAQADENSKIKAKLGRREKLLSLYRTTPQEWSKETAEMLVKIALEADQISYSRAAELLGISVYEIREKNWEQG